MRINEGCKVSKNGEGHDKPNGLVDKFGHSTWCDSYSKDDYEPQESLQVP